MASHRDRFATGIAYFCVIALVCYVVGGVLWILWDQIGDFILSHLATIAVGTLALVVVVYALGLIDDVYGDGV